jgi:REP element-mobilizing transposase RayT
MRRKRTQIANPDFINTLHVTQRCARHNFLLDDNCGPCGKFERRRNAILDRITHLAGAFAIEVLGVALMNNHLHLILRNRPDIVSQWSDLEVARRWLRICPGFSQAHADFSKRTPDLPTLDDAALLAKDREKIKLLRRRLADIGSLMWSLNDYSAKLFNLTDCMTGCFWEGRYKAQSLLDNLALLLCVLYVDLNPIRAGIAQSPEESEFTSAYLQIQSLEAINKRPSTNPSLLPNAFLAPIRISSEASAQLRSRTGCRASDYGFLDMSTAEYLIVLDLMGRLMRNDKTAAIPNDLPPIFERLKITFENAHELVRGYQQLFTSFVGTKASIHAKAQEFGLKRVQCAAITKKMI